MDSFCKLIWFALVGLFRSRASLQAENLVLRHQLNVLRRKFPQRITSSTIDRLLFRRTLCPGSQRLGCAADRQIRHRDPVRLADRNGLAIPAAVLVRDVRETHRVDEGVIEAWRQVYELPETHWMLYELAEKLVDFEDYFRRWRFNHVTTVERVIGFKRGTGGTGGVSYLKRMLEIELFPALWRVRTVL